MRLAWPQRSQLVKSFWDLYVVRKLICKRIRVCARVRVFGALGPCSIIFYFDLPLGTPAKKEHLELLFERISNQNTISSALHCSISPFNPIHNPNGISIIIWQMWCTIQCNNRLGNPFMHIVHFGNLLPFFFEGEGDREHSSIHIQFTMSVCMRVRAFNSFSYFLSHKILHFHWSVQQKKDLIGEIKSKSSMSTHRIECVSACVCWISFVFVEIMIKRSEMLL